MRDKELTANRAGSVRRGMTLIELLVVLIIIGILGAVTIRAMDTTRERGNYDKTIKTMERLAQGVAGNPSLIAEGRRTDFGFIGDMGRMPESLGELIQRPGSNPAWNGPYVRIPFVGDERSWRVDGWGQELQYIPEQGEIVSLGNGTFPVTYRIVSDTATTFRNGVSGVITDNQGNPPGVQYPAIAVRLFFTDPVTGQQNHYDTIPLDGGGRYEFLPPRFRIPAGNHVLRVVYAAGRESLTKYVQVLPRAGAIVDVRLPISLAGQLRLVTGSPRVIGDSSDNVIFRVVNVGDDTVRMDTLWFFRSETTTVCERLLINGNQRWVWTNPPNHRARGNDTLAFFPIPTLDSIMPLDQMQVELMDFRKASAQTDSINMSGHTLGFRFKDGSVITVPVP
jgi:prepilin-type N-terminal cleavage/methylation domain-containing protein